MPSARSTASTAAPAPRRPARPAPRRKPRRVVLRSPKLRVRWERVGRFGLLFVLVIVVGLYVEHTLSYFSTRAQASAQQATVDGLTRANRGLARQLQALNDPVTIVRDARALGMVRPGERAYAMTGQAQH